MSTNLGMTSPKTITTATVTQLLQTYYENEAYMESVQSDPIFQNRDLIKSISVSNEEAIQAMDQFFIDVTPKNTGARNITLAFVKALNMSPVEGNSSFIGNEGTIDMKWTKCYANDWAGGLTLQKFGIDFRELDNYKINPKAKRMLYQWRTEILGYYAREALVQRYSHNLTASPVSLSQSYNKNWWLPSLADSAQPTFSATAASHATSIGTAMNAAGMNAVLTPSYLMQLIDYLIERYLMPVRIGGKEMYGMLIAPRENRRLRDPAVSGSFGAYFKDAASIQDVNKVIPSASLVVNEKLILIPDPRISTTTLSGTGSAYTLTFGYDKAGRVTTKTSGVSTAGATNYWYNNIVLGAGAQMIYKPEDTHLEKQPDEYNQFEGNALFQAIGYQTPVWNVDAESTAGAQQESSYIVPTIKA